MIWANHCVKPILNFALEKCGVGHAWSDGKRFCGLRIVGGLLNRHILPSLEEGCCTIRNMAFANKAVSTAGNKPSNLTRRTFRAILRCPKCPSIAGDGGRRNIAKYRYACDPRLRTY